MMPRSSKALAATATILPGLLLTPSMYLRRDGFWCRTDGSVTNSSDGTEDA